MKQFYRKKLIWSVVSKVGEETLNVDSVSLSAIQWIASLVKEVKAKTVTKCFNEAEIISPVTVDNCDESDDDVTIHQSQNKLF
jgi:hypothetical protein